MSYTDQLIRSTDRLQKQSVLFFKQTGQAGVTFFEDTQAAGRSFAEELTAAGAKLFRSTSRATTSLGNAYQHEAGTLRDLAIKSRDAYAAELKRQTAELEGRAAEVRKALTPVALQTRVLSTASDVLGTAQKHVVAQLDEAKEPVRAPVKPPTKRTRAPQTARKGGRAPIRNYDQLTAKDVVGRIQRLSRPQATALIDYEQKRKNRATVIRAAKQRLAAS